jgi:hypothetical protein
MRQSDVEYAMHLGQGRKKLAGWTSKESERHNNRRGPLGRIGFVGHHFALVSGQNPICPLSHHIRWPYLHNTSRNLTPNKGGFFQPPFRGTERSPLARSEVDVPQTVRWHFEQLIQDQQVLVPAEVSSPAFERFRCVVVLNLSR